MLTAASRLARAVAQHRAARERLERAARAVPADAWTLPRAPGKWSPAEICEHLALMDEAALRELSGGAPMRRPLPRWKERLLNLTAMRWILATGRFPKAPAPRESRPVQGARDAGELDAVLARMRASAALLEERLGVAAPGRRLRLSHPYFGPIDARATLRMLARHCAHHAGQLEALTK